MNLHFRHIDYPAGYCGRELRSGWVEEVTGLGGDAAAVFVGPCRVATEDLVDNDDREAGAVIVAGRMAHVIVEHPATTLQVAVLRQRLLSCLVCEVLASHGTTTDRRGDDVFVGARKLTVSIAAPAPSGCLIHLGVNVDPTGAPVPAVGLDELGLSAPAFLDDLMTRYARELETSAYAETKVRAVS